MVVRLDAAGRIQTPDAYREALGLGDGDEVVIREEGERLILQSRSAAIRSVQRIVANHLPPGTDLVRDLIEERRLEAVAENEDATEMDERPRRA